MKRDDILAALRKFDTREVDIPGVGVCRIRPLSIRGAARLHATLASETNIADQAWIQVSECLVDEDGQPVFTDDMRDEFDLLPNASIAELVEAIGNETPSIEDAEGN